MNTKRIRNMQKSQTTSIFSLDRAWKKNKRNTFAQAASALTATVRLLDQQPCSAPKGHGHTLPPRNVSGWSLEPAPRIRPASSFKLVILAGGSFAPFTDQVRRLGTQADETKSVQASYFRSELIDPY